MEPEEFEKLVQKAILDLPQAIRDKIKNIAVCVENEANTFQLEKTGTRISNFLLGLYQGVPKTVWGRESSSGRLPDKITIFQKPIEKLAHSEQEITKLVKVVVWHEVAHHFGFSEKRMRALEEKWRNS